MDDDCKDYRKNKPQQKLYKPGSGPLRRSRYGSDAKMDQYDLENGHRVRDHSFYGSQHSLNGELLSDSFREQLATNSRYKKPEQQLYVARSAESGSDIDRQPKLPGRSDNNQYNTRRMPNKQERHGLSGTGSYSRSASGRDYHYKDGTNNDINYNRNYRQVSETRSISPAHSLVENRSVDRNRDSRSMETWAGQQKSGSGGKPPSGRRNSAGYPTDSRPKHMINLENIPPRFRKKFLEQSGHHSFESVDQLYRDRYNVNNMSQSAYNPSQFNSLNTGWSQTLPSRGRGRLRDNEHFDREKFLNSYMRSNDVQNSRRSTPSSSYLNLYDSSISEDKNVDEKCIPDQSVHEKLGESEMNVPKNGISKEESYDNKEVDISEDPQNDSESISHISTNLSDMTNLDWTEEVEKNIKLDDMCDASTSFSQNIQPSISQEVKPVESRESKRSGKSRRRDKRSSSRGHRNSEKKPERHRRDSNVSVHYESERSRKDSNVSIQQEPILSGLKQRERERRDSHKSNRSSTIGNSRDDLDRWRSLRSYSREQSTERKIVSQCNSRDTSTNRAHSPKDSDGFRIPASKSSNWSTASQKKSNGSWASGRQPSVERRRQSPTPSNVSVSAEGGGEASSGGGRRSRKKSGRRRGRNAENVQPITHVHQPSTSTTTNWREEILESKKQQSAQDRHPENHRNRLNSVLAEKSVSESSTSQPGLLILPQSSVTDMQKDQGRAGSNEPHKTLYDHHNPSKPIRVQTSSNKVDMRMERGLRESARGGGAGYETGAGEGARGSRHTALLQEVDRADAILKMHTMRSPRAIAQHWPDVYETRKVLQNALHRLLMSDLKYCQAENVEQKFWKILYYVFIENLRKSVTTASPEEKPEIVKLINIIIEEGNIFFENLVQMLEKTYKFNTDDYLNDNHATPPKGLGYVGLALISVQKLYVFLGDLARYKEQVNETNNFAKSKSWYTKAQQINPKNGRPYNQLAILAIYARRKLDAVYYYMRSLMSSNPFQSARESLISLFDENRKKYETAERKRRAALEAARAAEVGEESGGAGAAAGGAGDAGDGTRREVWVRPGGQRTATPRQLTEDTFDKLSTVELNKTFITSYLHVHGKLITKIGMESFHECAALMLRQFRALLHRQPLPTPAARLLQLTALNMFAVETTATSLRDGGGGGGGGGRSAWLECALGVSLLMFGAMVERCCALLPEPPQSQQHADALLLLPAIKVWSDWMLCHSSIWNPPPSLDNFESESENDPWDWLAKLMNILEALDDKNIVLESEAKEGDTCVRLAEDASLAGFTPLMYMEPAVAWARAAAPVPHHAAEHALRTRKLLFFGTEYLVGVEPPVLKLEYPAHAAPRYVSAVERPKPHYPQLQHLSEDSGQEDGTSGVTSGPASLTGLEVPETDEATRRLLRRKEQLESRKATLEKRRQRMQEMLGGGAGCVEVEVRPRWLVPDTNCFIDHLPLLQAVAAPPQPYQLAVPLVVVTELEGLGRCGRVGAAARAALDWVRGAAGVRLATARGSLLASRAFTAEQHMRACNDDRVLATALNLHANLANIPATEAADIQPEEASGGESKRSRVVREVVLLTDDRNLRVKAMAAELPARDLPSFVEWAGIHHTPDAAESQSASSADVNAATQN